MENKSLIELFLYAPQDFQIACAFFILAKVISVLAIIAIFCYTNIAPYALGAYGLFIFLSIFYGIKNMRKLKENEKNV